MALDNKSIMSKLGDFVEHNPNIQKKMRKKLKSHVDGGAKSIDQAALVDLGSKYIESAKMVARSLHVPQSVLNSMNSYKCGIPEVINFNEKNGIITVVCHLYIDNPDELSRYSLERLVRSRKGSFTYDTLYGAGQTTGDGIINIVKLFNTGYHAKRSVYGIWYPNRSPKGHLIESLQDRPPLHFMQSAAILYEKEMSEAKRGNVVYGYVEFKDNSWD